MTILAIGDSFTFGAELPDVPAVTFQISGRHYYNEEQKQTCEIMPSQLAWPALLGRELDLPVENKGLIGGSNDRIFRLAVSLTAKKKYNLVVCAWTAVGRLDISYRRQECAITPGFPCWDWVKTYYADHYNPDQEMQKWLAQIITLQSYFQIQGQPYVFVNSIRNSLDARWTNLAQKIDCSRYLGFNSSLREWCWGLPQGPDGHFLEQGHELVAKRFLKFVTDNDIL